MNCAKRLYDTNNNTSLDPQISGNYITQVPLVYPLYLLSQNVNFKSVKENLLFDLLFLMYHL